MNVWIDKKNGSKVVEEVKPAGARETRPENRRVSRNQFGRIKRKDHALDKSRDILHPPETDNP